MNDDTIQFKENTLGDWQILAILGRMDTLTASTAEVAAQKILADTAQLALDLSELEYISSAGLRILLRLAKQAKAAKKSFVLVNAHGLVKEVLDESGLAVLFKMVSSINELT